MNDTAGSSRTGRLPTVLTLRGLVPNAITAAALCSGLTGIRFAIAGDFEKSVLAVVFAGILDGVDGRAARLLKAQTRFGAELDSLADAISFGVAPALIVYLWSLQQEPRFGWIAALAYAICCVLRLARFNAQLDIAELPHKQAGFLTGVPSPAGAGLALLPMFLWIAADKPDFVHPVAVGAWMLLVAFLMISRIPTLSWSRLRPPRSIRLIVILLSGLLVAAVLTMPWPTLAAITIGYFLLIPFGFIAYARVRRQRLAGQPSVGEDIGC
ncbi:MAG: phosphatidylcholine/phosphatidylserine synthase [Novosphingobium sp.]|nr:phosphatidylcholine/phosphatidylserine synthase [Novosphingobium sp.]